MARMRKLSASLKRASCRPRCGVGRGGHVTRRTTDWQSSTPPAPPSARSAGKSEKVTSPLRRPSPRSRKKDSPRARLYPARISTHPGIRPRGSRSSAFSHPRPTRTPSRPRKASDDPARRQERSSCTRSEGPRHGAWRNHKPRENTSSRAALKGGVIVLDRSRLVSHPFLEGRVFMGLIFSTVFVCSHCNKSFSSCDAIQAIQELEESETSGTYKPTGRVFCSRECIEEFKKPSAS